MGEKMIEEGKSKGSGSLNELNAAGEHIKKSASLAGQAAKDTMYSAKEEGKATVDTFKDESQQLKQELGNEVDRFASEHHIKEGSRAPEDVLAQDHHQPHVIIAHDPSTKSTNTNQAAFNAANKFKEAKETISSDVSKAADFMKEEKDKLVNTAKDHNPMVDEKISADKTKPEWESKLEEHATNVVHDTSSLVEKDTNKVKEVWDDKTNEFKETATDMKEKASEVKDKAESAAEGLWGTTKENYGGSVKVNGPKKTLEEKFAKPNISTKAETEGKSIWGGMFSTSDKSTADDLVEGERGKPHCPEKHYTTYDYDKPDRFFGNPMVLEKRSPGEKTKPLWETSLEEHAQEYTHDTTTLVDKDTDKVKKGVWDAKIKTNDKNSPIHGESRGAAALHKVEEKASDVAEEIEEEASSVWSSLFGGAEAKTNEAEIKWNDAKNKANEVKKDAASTWEDAKGKVQSEADHVKSNLNSAIDDAKDQGARMTRQASDRVDYEKDRLSGNLNDLHKEVSENAEKWKNQGEQTAKSWYQKGTDKVRSELNSVKNVADQDVQWAEEKVKDGVEGLKSSLSGTKEEMDRVLSLRNEKEEDLQGHVRRGERYAEEEAGLLRDPRSDIRLKPAKVVVEEAHGRDM
jgi:hypothetical protein